MSYQIEYNTVGLPKPKGKPQKTPNWALLCVALCLLLALGIKCLGLPWVQQVLLPGDPAVTAAALENMVADLKGGASLIGAITAFCQEILQGAAGA